MEFRGVNGKVVVLPDCVSILREKSIDTFFHEDRKKEIFYEDIRDVKYTAGGITNGYICFVEWKHSYPKGIIEAMKDENTIIFRMFQNHEAKKFVKQLKKMIGCGKK